MSQGQTAMSLSAWSWKVAHDHCGTFRNTWKVLSLSLHLASAFSSPLIGSVQSHVFLRNSLVKNTCNLHKWCMASPAAPPPHWLVNNFDSNLIVLSLDRRRRLGAVTELVLESHSCHPDPGFTKSYSRSSRDEGLISWLSAPPPPQKKKSKVYFKFNDNGGSESVQFLAFIKLPSLTSQRSSECASHSLPSITSSI